MTVEARHYVKRHNKVIRIIDISIINFHTSSVILTFKNGIGNDREKSVKYLLMGLILYVTGLHSMKEKKEKREPLKHTVDQLT